MLIKLNSALSIVLILCNYFPVIFGHYNTTQLTTLVATLPFQKFRCSYMIDFPLSDQLVQDLMQRFDNVAMTFSLNIGVHDHGRDCLVVIYSADTYQSMWKRTCKNRHSFFKFMAQKTA